MVTATADGSSLRRSRRLKEDDTLMDSLMEQQHLFDQEESDESDGDPDFNHKDFEWLYKLPRKPQPKQYVESGIYEKQNLKNKAAFRFRLPTKHKKRLLESPKDFQLPPNIWQPLYPLTSVNGWKTLTRNIWTKEALEVYESIAEKVPECVCEEDCDEDCLNRASKIECDTENCPFTYCTNRAFQMHAKLPPPYMPTKNSEYAGGRVLYSRGYEVFATGPKGFGLRATREYQPHELILEYTGEVITNDEMAHRMSTIYAHTRKYYCLSFVNGLVIDSGIKGSEARYVNHSCRPNCEMQKWYVKGDPRIGLFVGDEPIPAGTELAYDYNFDIFKGAIGQKCYCGEQGCRGIIGKRFPKETKRARRGRARASAIAVGRQQELEPEERKKLKIRISLRASKKKLSRRSTPYDASAATGPRASRRTRQRASRRTYVSSQASDEEERYPSVPQGPSMAERRAERARIRATLQPINPKCLPRMRSSRKNPIPPRRLLLLEGQQQQQEHLAEVQADVSAPLNVCSLLNISKDTPSPDSSISSGFHTFEEDADMPSSHTSAQESDTEFLGTANGGLGDRVYRKRSAPAAAPDSADESEYSSIDESPGKNGNQEPAERGKDSRKESSPPEHSDEGGSVSDDEGQDNEGEEDGDSEGNDEGEEDDDDEEEEEESDSDSDSEPQEEQEFFPTKAARHGSTPKGKSQQKRKVNYSRGRPRLTEEQKAENAHKRKNGQPVLHNSGNRTNPRSIRHRRRAGDENEVEELQELPATKRHRRRRDEKGDYEDISGPASELERQQFLEDNMHAGDKLKESLVKSENEAVVSSPSRIPGPVEPINGNNLGDPTEVPPNAIPPKPIPSVMAFNRTNYMDRHFSLGDRLANTVAGKPLPETPTVVSSVATAPSPPTQKQQELKQQANDQELARKPQQQVRPAVQPIPVSEPTVVRPRTRASTSASSNGNSARPTNILTAAEVAATFNRSSHIPIQQMTTVPARITPAIPTQTRRHPTSPRNSQRMEVRLPANNNPPSTVPANALNQIQHAQAQQQPQPQPQQQGMVVQPHMPYMFMNSFQMANQMVTVPQFPMQFGQMGMPQQVAVQTPQGAVMMMQPPMMMMPQNAQRSMPVQFPQQMMYSSPQQQQHQGLYTTSSAPMTPHFGGQQQQFVQNNHPHSQPQTPLVLPNGQQVVFQSSPVVAPMAQQSVPGSSAPSPAIQVAQAQVPDTPTPQSHAQSTPVLDAQPQQSNEGNIVQPPAGAQEPVAAPPTDPAVATPQPRPQPLDEQSAEAPAPVPVEAPVPAPAEAATGEPAEEQPAQVPAVAPEEVPAPVAQVALQHTPQEAPQPVQPVQPGQPAQPVQPMVPQDTHHTNLAQLPTPNLTPQPPQAR